MERKYWLQRNAIVQIAAVCCCAVLMAAPCRSAEDFAAEAATLKARYAADLTRLADWCRAKNLTTEAKTTLVLAAPPDPYTIVLPLLPREIGAFHAPEGPSDVRNQWQRQFLQLREEYAAALFTVAQRAASRHHASLAYRLALDVIRANPDHEGARRIFGFQRYRNQWHTPFEVQMLREGMVWNEKFGWIEKANLPRYAAGERLMGATWIDAKNDAQLHDNILNGWDIETEHYRIRTNHSIEAAVALGVKLENLNRVWRQMFIGYYATPAELEALFSSRSQPVTNPPRLEVVYFRNREQYHRALKPSKPDIGISMGLYVAENHTAYFYAGSEDSERTMYHEATHQLFQQSRPAAKDVGRTANCWLIEGIALYMETLRRDNDSFVLGGLRDVRMEAARYHLDKGDFYVPFEKLVKMGVQDVQTHRQIAMLYSQIAGMTSFLVHFDNGRYRDALVATLAATYDGSQDADLLARMTGVNYDRLDKQYHVYMREDPKVGR
jgi:hypothetical protein